MKQLNRVGEMYKNRYGEDIKIIEYTSEDDLTIMFTNHEHNTEMYYVRSHVPFCTIKRMASPYHKNKYGGYIGVGCMTKEENSKPYLSWISILSKCYEDKSHTVCDEWLNFQLYCNWYQSNYINGYIISKNVFIKGSKHYSPETCALVPFEIQRALTAEAHSKKRDVKIGVHNFNRNGIDYCLGIVYKYGKKKTAYYNKPNSNEKAALAYKKTKEAHVQQLTKKYWKKKLISNRIYEALMQYQVNIED